MTTLRNIIDTWNMIEKYHITVCATTEHGITINDSDFQRMLVSSLNKRYVKNLLAKNGRFCTHGYC
ncbi:MAG: hypothetical protein HFE92_03030 [Acutalibacter muris]|nr:hypothetical protein [Acutalibacter muris]